MATTTPAAQSEQQQQQQTSRLLALPAELQLLIYELVVTSPTPLLLNCACDSSYPDNEAQLESDTAAWAAGTKHPPLQPALTLTCSSIRADALPMFYQLNTFNAHYCYAVDFDTALRWLEMIGPRNRGLLGWGRCVLVDDNPEYDEWAPRDLVKARRKLWKGFRAGVPDVGAMASCCSHPVSFGEGEGVELEGVEFEGLEKMFREGHGEG